MSIRETTRTTLVCSSLAFCFGFIPLIWLSAPGQSRAQAPHQDQSKPDTSKRSSNLPPGLPSMPQPDAPGDFQPRRQTQKDFDEMHKRVLEIYGAIEQDWLGGKPTDLEIIYRWSRRVLRAQLRTSSKKDDRIAAFQAFVDRADKMRKATHKKMLSALANAKREGLREAKSGALEDMNKSECYLVFAVELYMREKTGKDGGWVPLEPLE
jgi:hypothetical protein